MHGKQLAAHHHCVHFINDYVVVGKPTNQVCAGKSVGVRTKIDVMGTRSETNVGVA